MLAVSVIFVILYIFGLGGVFARAIIMAPKYFQYTQYQMRYKFLFLKFHAEAYWWGLVILLKMLLINLSMVIASNGVDQMFLVMTVNIVYTVGIFLVFPYRHRVANALEVLSGFATVYA